MELTGTLLTGYGFWNPVFLILAGLVTSLVAYLLWRRGVSTYRRGSEQERPYLSGNPEPEKNAVHIRGGNVYWGFTEGLKGFYSRVIPAHSGDLNDYMLWYFGVMIAICAVVVIVQ
ncbi:MAG: hydrogenase [Methanocalculus sp. MSAO_Arc1]|uniref:hydrogenase n=1 Tax=Methanocalculus TaxID=71151 RepID=UPI000FED4DB6|nr:MULTISPECIES: hydrogenase [unclassified Methanocalculus]MCP1662794.1 hypothetical protein [Methanocalculus sp. AMF5]RQD81064.1 MAG: hydrogenase [Methanocalculus sp. MSAO_Arc1]